MNYALAYLVALVVVLGVADAKADQPPQPVAAGDASAPPRSETLRLGAAAGAPGQIYATREGRPVVLTLPDAILARFDRKVYEVPPQEAVSGVELSGTVGDEGPGGSTGDR